MKFKTYKNYEDKNKISYNIMSKYLFNNIAYNLFVYSTEFHALYFNRISKNIKEYEI